jgi:hypothetical protein
MSTLRLVALYSFAACLSVTAEASVPDKFGVGGRWKGVAGAGAALVDDGAAPLFNPAGLARVRQPTAAVGILGGFHHFEQPPALWWDTNRDGSVDDRDSPLEMDINPDPAVGFEVQMARQVGGKFGLGFVAYVPTRGLIRFQTFEPDLPNYFMYDNRPHRYAAAAGVGGTVLPGVSIGLAVDVMAKAQFDVAIGLDATITSQEDGEEVVGGVVAEIHAIDFALVPAFAPMIGLQLDFGAWTEALKGVSLGLAYHGAVGIDIAANLDAQANIGLSEIGSLEPYTTAAVFDVDFAIYDHYHPARLNIGLGYQPNDRFTAVADLRWTDWRKLQLNVTQINQVEIISPLFDLDDAVSDGNDYSMTLRSVVSARGGIELAIKDWSFDGKLRYAHLRLRLGAGYEPTPMVSQGESSAFLDADRWMLTTGLGVRHWDPFDLIFGEVRTNFFAQLHGLFGASLARQASTPTPGYPVDVSTLPIGGTIVVLGGQVSFDY